MKSKIKILLLASLLLMSNLAKSEVPGPPVAPVKDCNQYKMQIDELRLKIAAQKKALARLANTPSTLARHEMFNCNKIMEELQVQKAIAQNHYMQCTGSNVKYKNAQQLEKKAAAEKAAAEKAAAEKAAAEKATSTKSQAQIDAQEKRANLNANRARNDEFQAKRQADKIMKENEEILKRNKIKSELDKTGMAAGDQEQLIKLNEAQRKAQVKANKPASDKANSELIEREAAANKAAGHNAPILNSPLGGKALNKDEFAIHLQEILTYTADVDATVTELERRDMTAQQWNTRLIGLSSAQLACGLAATALGITLIAITAGVATPAVAAASVAIGAAAMGTGIGGAAVGAAGGVAKAGRKNALGETNKNSEHLSDPNSKKKAAGVEGVKAGVIKGGIEGTNATVAASGASIGAQAVVGSSIGAVGGVASSALAANNIYKANEFKKNDEAAKLYREQGLDWDIIHTNLQNFRIALGNTKYTSINPSFCKQVRDKVRITEDKAFKISQRLKMKAEAAKAAAAKAAAKKAGK